MRDRLMELMRQAENKHLNLLEFEKSILADYLLANGVIVPPCKVGQTMYVISRYYGGEWKIFECKVNDITVYESNIFISLNGVNNFCFAENVAQIGKTVFATREEAEAKLKEGGKDDN